MDTNLGILICLIILGFLFYYLYTTGAIVIPALNKNERNEGNDGNEGNENDGRRENFEMPGPGADVVVPIINEPPRRITPSGPNPPSQDGQDGEAIIYGDPAAKDPYAEQVEMANAPENMRNPERAYRPAPQNTDTMIPSASGVASPIMDTTPGAIQAFNTDFVENRGEFMEGVFANDTNSSEMNFSAF